MIYNLTTVAYLECLLGLLIIINTVLGVVNGIKKLEFSWSKLFKGIGNAFLIASLLLAFCLVLEMIPIVLARIDFKIPSELITIIEVFGMLVVAISKYGIDCFDKFKKILEKEEEK